MRKSYAKDPAFPTAHIVHGDDGEIEHGFDGLTVRDYFAAKAMQALIAKGQGQGQTCGRTGVPVIARFAFEYADAMLERREV